MWNNNPQQQPAYAPPVVYQQQPVYGQPAYGQPAYPQQAYGSAPQGGQPAYPYPAPAQPYAAPAQPYAPAANLQYSAPHATYPGTGRKKAVLIGCTYPGTSAQLRGCINDVQCMDYLLKSKFNFQPSDIMILRDDTSDPRYMPTRANIMNAVRWLVSDQRPGDSLFFHFSGHGSQKRDYNGDEADGMDETLCPTDYKYAGQIVDDELNQALVRPLMPGVTLHAVIDACHSGTALDLPCITKCKHGRFEWKGHTSANRGTSGGLAIQFGACRDSQTAQDTRLLSGSVHTGAATYCFIKAVEQHGVSQTYGQVLQNMHAALQQATGGSGTAVGGSLAGGLTGLMVGGLVGGVVGAMLGGGLQGCAAQQPVLSCDKPIDLTSMRLAL